MKIAVTMPSGEKLDLLVHKTNKPCLLCRKRYAIRFFLPHTEDAIDIFCSSCCKDLIERIEEVVDEFAIMPTWAEG